MNGIVNGVCTDPRSYFFDRIGRQEQGPANDWKQVLEGLHAQGMRKNPTPGERPSPDPFYGITVMIDAGGNARGRIWLPTAEADANGYFTREVQVIADRPDGVHGQDFVWAWEENRGAPPYVPVGAPINPPSPATPELPSMLEQELRTLRDELRAAVATIKKQSYSGTISNRLLGTFTVTLIPKE